MPNPFLTDATAMKKRRGPNQEHHRGQHQGGQHQGGQHQEHHRGQTQDQARENPFLTRPSYNHANNNNSSFNSFSNLESPVAAAIPAPQLSFEESFPSLSQSHKSQSQPQGHSQPQGQKSQTLNFKSAVQSDGDNKSDHKSDNKSDNKSDDKSDNKSDDNIASTHSLNNNNHQFLQNQFLRPVNQFLQPRSTNPHIRRGRNECNEDDDNNDGNDTADAYDSAYTKYYQD